MTCVLTLFYPRHADNFSNIVQCSKQSRLAKDVRDRQDNDASLLLNWVYPSDMNKVDSLRPWILFVF